jgi:hypothetical protein
LHKRCYDSQTGLNPELGMVKQTIQHEKEWPVITMSQRNAKRNEIAV